MTEILTAPRDEETAPNALGGLVSSSHSMTESRRLALIALHRKAEAAYLRFGRRDQADQARRLREALEAGSPKEGRS